MSEDKYKNTGAFPYAPTCDRGMTLRDYFAGQALSGLLSDHMMIMAAGRKGCKPCANMAGSAYEYADAMLKARQS